MEPLGLAKRLARWGGILGLALGSVYAFGGLIIDARDTGLNRGTLLAFGALVGMPAIGAAGGFILGTVVGAIVQGFRALRNRNHKEF